MVISTPVTTSISKLGASLLISASLKPPLPDAVEACGVFVSPASVSLALALLLNGAVPASSAYRELLLLLAKGCSDMSEVNSGFAAFLEAIKASNAPDAGLTVSIANSVWAKPRNAFKPAYLQLLSKHLAASAHALTSASEVNKWCKLETRGKIDAIVDQGTVDDTDAILVNAVYFKGLWASPFKKASTQRLPFHLAEGQSVDVPMMSRKFEGREGTYAHGPSYTAVRLPYQGKEFAGVAVLPADGKTVQDVIHDLLAGSDTLPNGIGSIKWQGGDFFVFLPRFKIETELKLAGVLKQLGVASIFAPSNDFADMLESPDPLRVDEVIHKVYIEVNEEGTEAAAVTAVMMRCCALAVETPEFRFDKPFVFTILHETTNTLLFSGIVSKPDAWAGDTTADCPPSGPPPGYPTAS